MLKKAQVVMLPTEDRCFIFMNKNKTWLKSSNVILDDHPVERNQHLYIVSDDEIKEGDWFIQTHQAIQTLVQCDKQNVEAIKHFQSNVLKAKKIIATTDTSLRINSELSNSNSIKFQLPQPSQQFIEKYIESYNKGNVIIDVLVELLSEESYGCDLAYYGLIEPEIKVNLKDNTITIKKLKDNWNREELIEKLKSILYDSSSLVYTFPDNTVESIDDELFNNWIKDNL